MNNNQSKILIVLGMHRSGTSLFSNWLHLSGVNMGDRLLGKMDSNQKGHFEDMDFLEFHRAYLKDLNTNWIYKEEPVLEFNTYWKAKASSIVAMKNTLHDQWGWKDPRTCLFLDLWESILPLSHKIVVFRDYKSVVHSLVKRDEKLIDTFEGKAKKIRRYVQKKRFQSNVHSKANLYLNTWCVYNEKLITLYENNTQVPFLNSTEIRSNIDIIRNIITAHFGINIKTVDWSEVYDESLWSSQNDISEYQFDKELELRATKIQNRLLELQQRSKI